MENNLREGIRLLAKNNPVEALRKADRYVADRPADAEAWSIRAHVKSLLKKYQDAIADMTRAIALLKNEPEYYYTRGQFLFAVGNYPEAISDFTTTIKLTQELGSNYYLRSALFFRADANVRLCNYEEARSDCLKLPEDFRTWTDRLRTRASILGECKRI